MMFQESQPSALSTRRIDYTQFTYKEGKRYIRLTQFKKELSDMHFPFYYHQPKKELSLILDEDLCVVSKNGDKVNFELDLEKKIQQNEGEIKLSFLQKKDTIPETTLSPIFYEKVYDKYVESGEYVTDFQFGRSGFGRAKQSHKIQSDSISKYHCSLWHLPTNNLQLQKYQNTISKIFKTKTPIYSTFRKISTECWDIIFSYLRKSEKYYIVDEGSRNGTYIQQLATHSFKLMESFEYEFNGEKEYEIFISKIFAPSNTLDKSVTEHNQEVGNLIEQYKKKIEWGYYERARKSLIIDEKFQVQPEQKIRKQTAIKYSFIVIKLKYRNDHEYYCLVVGENEKRTYNIGHKNTINVYPQEEDDIETLDGYISCQNGIWKINSFESEYNDRNIWIKIPAKYDYSLSPRQKYRFRLAYTASFFLQFKNFQP